MSEAVKTHEDFNKMIKIIQKQEGTPELLFLTEKEAKLLAVKSGLTERQAEDWVKNLVEDAS